MRANFAVLYVGCGRAEAAAAPSSDQSDWRHEVIWSAETERLAALATMVAALRDAAGPLPINVILDPVLAKVCVLKSLPVEMLPEEVSSALALDRSRFLVSIGESTLLSAPTRLGRQWTVSAFDAAVVADVLRVAQAAQVRIAAVAPLSVALRSGDDRASAEFRSDGLAIGWTDEGADAPRFTRRVAGADEQLDEALPLAFQRLQRVAIATPLALDPDGDANNARRLRRKAVGYALALVAQLLIIAIGPGLRDWLAVRSLEAQLNAVSATIVANSSRGRALDGRLAVGDRLASFAARRSSVLDPLVHISDRVDDATLLVSLTVERERVRLIALTGSSAQLAAAISGGRLGEARLIGALQSETVNGKSVQRVGIDIPRVAR